MKRRATRYTLRALVAASALVWTRAACADAAAAEALFREGRKLLDEGQIDAACVKLAESQVQEASSGTLLNLALCHEKQRKLATAWAEYAAAARLSNAQGKPERADVATAKAAELESRLPRVTIRSDGTIPGLKISRGKESLGTGAIGTAVPVDPGSHVITASAPGYRSWTTTIAIAEAESTTVEVPLLEPELAVPSPASDASQSAMPIHASVPDDASRGAVRFTGWIAGGAGVAALGVGAAFGLASLIEYRDADRLCPTHRSCDDGARSTRDRAEVHAWVANVSLGVGVLGLAAGAYLLLTGNGEASSAKTTLDMSPRAGGGALRFQRRF